MLSVRCTSQLAENPDQMMPHNRVCNLNLAQISRKYRDAVYRGWQEWFSVTLRGIRDVPMPGNISTETQAYRPEILTTQWCVPDGPGVPFLIERSSRLSRIPDARKYTVPRSSRSPALADRFPAESMPHIFWFSSPWAYTLSHTADASPQATSCTRLAEHR